MNNIASTTWEGYLRPDGRKGVRNIVLVIYTVQCASHVSHSIAKGQDDVHVIGFPGCYDNQYAVRLMLALARHPNVGAVLSVGLGCEYTQPEKIADVVRKSGRPADWFYIQDAGGTRAGIEKGVKIIAQLREEMHRTGRRVPMTLADLCIGCECGGSDGTSGLAGNPVVGRFFDRLVDVGGTAIFEEIVEMIGLKEVMLARAASADAAAQIDIAYEKAVRYCQSVRQYSVSPGNFAGGLTTIEEKSMGAFAKSGSRIFKASSRSRRHRRIRACGLWTVCRTRTL
jgi:altronate hydrolase